MIQVTHQNLTQLADQLLAGDITVDQADVLAYAGRTITDTSAYVAPVVRDFGNHAEESTSRKPCICDDDVDCRALYLYREGVSVLFGKDEDRELAAGLRAYNALPKDDRRDWLRGRSLEVSAVRAYLDLLARVAYVEESCPAQNHYVRCHTAVWNDLLRSPVTSQDESKLRENRDEWELLERKRLSWPLVSFEPADEERGYLPDPTSIKSSSALAREYAAPSSYVTTEYVKDEHGYVVLYDDGSRLEREVEVPTMGAVQWEYRRRQLMASKGLTPLPYWMTSRQYAAVKAQERRMDRKRRLARAERAALIALIERMGGDPRDPKVAEWVTTNGITNCLEALKRRQAVAV